MSLSLEDIEAELARRGADSSNSNTSVDAIDAELARRGVTSEGSGPTRLQKTAATLTHVMQAINNPGAAMGFEQPPVNEMGPQGDQLFDKAGTSVAEFLGKHGAPGTGAALGTAVSMANPMNWISPSKTGEVRAFEPNVPSERAAGVQAAQELGVPLTRAEQSGAKSSSLLESGLEKTFTGSGTIRNFRKTQAQAIDTALQKLKSQLGTKELLSSSGEEAKIGMQSELGQARNTGRDLYRDIPDVPIETPNLLKAKDDATFNQAHLTDPEVARAVSRIEQVVERNPMQKEVGMDAKATPELVDRPTPTFQKLNELRNELSAQIQGETTYNPITGPQTTPTGRRLTALKKALDEDIKTYSSSDKKPFEQMESKEFSKAFTKANAFHGAVKDLINNKLVRKISKAPGSDVAGTVFKSGNIEDVLTARAALGENGYKAVQKQFFNDLLESKNIGTELSKYEPEFLSSAFSPDQLQALKKLDSVKQLALGAEKIAGNPSGTAQNVATSLTFGGLIGSGVHAMTSPLTAIAEATAILGIPFASAKAYIGLSRGVKVPAQALAEMSARSGSKSLSGLNVIGDNPDNKNVLSKVLKKMKTKE